MCARTCMDHRPHAPRQLAAACCRGRTPADVLAGGKRAHAQLAAGGMRADCPSPPPPRSRSCRRSKRGRRRRSRSTGLWPLWGSTRKRMRGGAPACNGRHDGSGCVHALPPAPTRPLQLPPTPPGHPVPVTAAVGSPVAERHDGAAAGLEHAVQLLENLQGAVQVVHAAEGRGGGCVWAGGAVDTERVAGCCRRPGITATPRVRPSPHLTQLVTTSKVLSG